MFYFNGDSSHYTHRLKRIWNCDTGDFATCCRHCCYCILNLLNYICCQKNSCFQKIYKKFSGFVPCDTVFFASALL